MYKNDIFNTTMGKVKDIKNLKKAIEFYFLFEKSKFKCAALMPF